MLSHHGAPPLPTARDPTDGPVQPCRPAAGGTETPEHRDRSRTDTLGHMGYIVSLIDGDDHIPNASDALVSDGHLRVVTGVDRRTVAVYAPGQWLNAREDGKATFVADGGSRRYVVKIDD